MDRQQIESLHQQASDHYVRGEYREALDAWKRVLDLDPEDEKAREGARLSGLLGDSEVGEPLGSEAAIPLEDPALPSQGLLARLAEIDSRIESGDLHGALRCAESLESERPEDPEVLSALARACAAAGDSDRAAEATSRMLSMTPEYAEAAALLEECRRVSPAESPLGIVELREQGALHAPSGESFGELDPQTFLGSTEELELELVPTLVRSSPGWSEEKALAPVTAGSGRGASQSQRPLDPAANVLGQRVDDLLRQARTAAAGGRSDDALGLLSRLLILDEENEEGLTLERQLRQDPVQKTRTIEEIAALGMGHFEKGELEQARQAFLEVLESDPDHREALEFLEKTDGQLAAAPVPEARQERRSAASKARGSVWQAPAPEEATAAEADAVAAEDPIASERPSEDVVAGRARPRKRLPLPSLRWVAAAAFGLLVLAGGFLGVRRFLARSGEPAGSNVTIATPDNAPERRPLPARAETPPPAPVETPEERAAGIARTMARAATALEAGDYEAAILAYNSVLALDPEHAEARMRLLESGDLYRKSKAEIEKLAQARQLFSSGEYESALRVLYRLPEGLLSPAVLNRYKVNGWYDLGIVALRGADCGEATLRFAEASALDGSDAGVRRGKQLADACRGQRKDRAYYDVVESLPFRQLDD